MDHPKKQTPDYGNWVSNRLFYITGGLSLLFTALCVVSPFFPPWNDPFHGMPGLFYVCQAKVLTARRQSSGAHP
jgi:hypothetical protein